MQDLKSVLAGGDDTSATIAETRVADAMQKFPLKFYWFISKGYVPHTWRATFHGAEYQDKLCLGRHLVAGRRGGKTLAAAWEMAFYAVHPDQFYLDAHGEHRDRALWMWVLTKDYPTGFAAQHTLLEVFAQAGLVSGKDFKFNKTERKIEFTNGTLIQFKTADDPQSLRGAGLDILWIDEAGFVVTDDAWVVTSPALADRDGIVMTTTTPHGKNWYYEEWFTGKALADPREFRVQYTSIDNPYFSREQWQRYKERYHPILFKQEFLASFEAMHGIALQGDWLHYWVSGRSDPGSDDYAMSHLLDPETGRYDLEVFIGIDPAVSLSDTADYFAMAAIGFTKNREQGFLLDTFMDRVAFPDQLDLIRSWVLKWRPVYVGIESNAFQQALVQQTVRLDGFPGIVPVLAKGKKNERILTMSPLFKIGKVRVHAGQADFIDQWITFDPDKRNQKDDLLDAVEIALSVAGVLLPMQVHASLLEGEPAHVDHADVATLIRHQIEDQMNPSGIYDPEIGDQF
jgi:phage terminase large subunit-like protein